jgi:hypothetical protein
MLAIVSETSLMEEHKRLLKMIGLDRALQRLRSWLSSPDRPFDAPEDPYAPVREPRRRGPGGRSAAIAVEEPEPSTTVRARGNPLR